MNIKRSRILIVDNYDSFTFNLVQIVEENGACSFDVIKNDIVNIEQTGIYDGFIFSPGPGIPGEVPLMSELLRIHYKTKSFLGICLGHQAIAEYFGMKLSRLANVRHGIRALIRITDPSDYIFEGIPTEFEAGLYHSWTVCFESSVLKPGSNLRIIALGDDDIIMAVAHPRYDIRGLQFHPESYLTDFGDKIINNWIAHLNI